MFFFFFKQKTAYEMRISDWSSDVCSSDLTEGRSGRTEQAVTAMTAWLRYPVNEQHYFSGFVLKNEDRAQWARIAAAADAARGRGVAAVFIWALPQACRDGFPYFRIGEDEAVQAFGDVLFPLGLGREARVFSVFTTHVLDTQSSEERGVGKRRG